MFPPNIMEEVVQLSPAALWIAVGISLVLLILGYQLYKFWIVFVATVAAGLVGLYQGPVWGVHPALGAGLAALAGGILSLSLFRLFAFLSGGIALAVATGLVVPGPGEMLILFVVGGLIALLLERFWMALASSFLGSWLLAFALLGLLDRGKKLDAVTWVEDNTKLLPILVGVGTLLGAGIQYWVYRWLHSRRVEYNDLGQQNPQQQQVPQSGGFFRSNPLGRRGRH
jgi:hypothetical protein